MTTDADVPGQFLILSEEEWNAAIQHDLDKLGLTRDDLAEMAKGDDFSCIQAKSLWWLVRDSSPEKPGHSDAAVRHDTAVAA
jgi:hypothetical protein